MGYGLGLIEYLAGVGRETDAGWAVVSREGKEGGTRRVLRRERGVFFSTFVMCVDGVEREGRGGGDYGAMVWFGFCFSGVDGVGGGGCGGRGGGGGAASGGRRRKRELHELPPCVLLPPSLVCDFFAVFCWDKKWNDAPPADSLFLVPLPRPMRRRRWNIRTRSVEI